MSPRVTFTFEGREIEALDGQTIAGALHAAGVRTLSWSSKYRRPRGLRCGTGACVGCTLAVDGAGGIAACLTPIRGGERVERIRPWLPWLPADRFGFLVPAGFQGARWLRSARVWRCAERLFARLAGQAIIPDAGAPGLALPPAVQERVVDVLVIGGGVTGLLAAVAEARWGWSVLLVDQGPEPGGRLLDQPGGLGRARALADGATGAGVEILAGATGLGTFDEGVTAVVHGRQLLEVRAGRVIRATGTLDREVSLPDGDRPGVLLATAVARLVVRDGVRPGARAVIVEAPDGVADAASVAVLLEGAGTRVVGRCVPADVQAIHGRSAVRSVTLAGRRIRCDLVVVAGGRRDADELDRQAFVPLEPHVG